MTLKKIILISGVVMLSSLLALSFYFRHYLTTPTDIQRQIANDLPENLTYWSHGPISPRNLREKIFGFEPYTYDIVESRRLSSTDAEALCIQLEVYTNITDNLRKTFGPPRTDFAYIAQKKDDIWSIELQDESYHC